MAVELPPDAVPTLTAPATAVAGNYTVSWTAPGGAQTYTLQEKVGSGSWSTAYSGAALSKAYSGKPSGSYGYRIRACNPAGCTAYSAARTVQSVHVPTASPALTVPATTTTGSYTVGWGTVTGAGSYQLEQQANGGSWVQQYAGTATSKAYSGVVVGVYGYRVRACNAAGCGPFSAVKSITRSPTVAPTMTTPTATLPGSYTVSWTAVAGATGYRLEEKVGSGSWAEVQNATSRSKAYTGKAPGTYSYRARGCNAAGCGPYATAKSTQVYAAATLTAPASSNTGNYTVSWTAVTSATAYRLDEKAGSSSWTQVANAAATSKAFTGKSDGTYQYRVRGCNAAGCGAYSAAKATVVTLPSLPPATPTGVQGEYFDNEITPYKTTYLFSWNASEGASYYELSPSYGSSQILGTFYRHVVSGIQGPVSFRVRACNTNGCSAWSPEVETQHL